MQEAAHTASRHVISVLIADRPGILRDVTAAVSALDGNIDAIRQTVVAGYFTVMLTATFPEPCRSEDLQRRMQQAFAPGEAHIATTPYDAAYAKSHAPGERYVVTLTGIDHSGILSAVTGFMATRHINIEDWNVIFDGNHVTHVAEVTVPPNLDIKQLQIEFRHLAETLGLHAGIQHENIFRAISEVGPIKPLVTKR